MKFKLITSTLLCTVLISSTAFSQVTKTEENIAAAKAVNPLAYVTKLQFQPVFTFIGTGGKQLALFSRIVQPSKSIGLPFIKSKSPHWYTLYRLEAPLISQTVSDNASKFNATGTGDFIVLDAITYRAKWGQVGVGPALLIPLASPQTLGTGKWCAGPTAIVVYTKIPKLQLAFLVQQFFSFSGDPQRPGQNFMYFQPQITKLFDKGLFLQTFPIMKLDWKNDKYNIPVNLLLGKAFAKDRSMYLGPQYVVSGALKDTWSIFFNINTMF